MGNLQPGPGQVPAGQPVSPYVPMRYWHSPEGTTEAAPAPVVRSSSTSPGYSLSLLPAVHAFLLVAIAVVRSGETTWPIIGATNLVMMMLGVLIARADQRALAALGLAAPTSPWLSLPSPLVYLVVRGNRAYRQTFTGLRPFWLGVLVTAASAAAVILAPTIANLVGRLQPG